MSQNRVLYLIVIASFFALVVGGGYQTEGNAQVQSTSKESEQQTITVPYEAMLTDKSGNPVDDGLYDFTFTLYGSETDTHLLWSEVQEGIDVQGGRVFTNLGAMRPFPQSLNKDGGTLWLEVGVRGPGEVVFTVLEPRQHLSTSIQTTQSSTTAEDVCAHDHFGEVWNPDFIKTGIGLDIRTNEMGVFAWSENSTALIGVNGMVLPWSEPAQHGVLGYSGTSHGIVGKTGGEWSWISGVYGEAWKTNNIGVTGWNQGDGVGVYGYSENGDAGYFNGPVTVTGFLTKSGGGFKIDHPLDPANKYLNHSFVESPEMKNIYDGVVNLDADGAAWVELPEWFEALNKDFRYQLTPIGAPGSNLYIAQEIENKRFRIAGGDPGLKVSWQVTGSRHDAFAEEHPIVVEEEKPLEEQGTYLHPEEQGKPQTEGLDYQRNQPPEQFETGGE